MTQAIWVDATYGAAGDMLLAALLDAGASRPAVDEAVAALAQATAERIGLRTEPVRRHGLRAGRAVVEWAPSDVRRGPDDVRDIVHRCGLSAAANAFAVGVFERIADAEAHAHDVARADVHFHEVGALDALADVVGCAVALDSLGLLDESARRVVSRVGVGSGRVSTEHGELPVPVPATLEILTRAGAPIEAGPGRGELCTPTGAAVLATLATEWGELPPMTASAVGVGAGSADPPTHPNVVRVVVGAAAATPSATWSERDLVCVESTVDDLDPRLWPGTLDALHASGAVDAWLTPVLMRHGRPGHVVTAIAPAAVADAVFDRLVRDTTTLGARLSTVRRRSLARDVVHVDVPGGPVGVKRGLADGEVVTVQPEFAEALAAAERSGRPVTEILDIARDAARRRQAT